MSIFNLDTGLLRKSTMAALVVGLPLAGCGSSVTAGAAGGAATGAAIAGPVGAAVGGVTGATVGAAIGALTPDETVRVREYVVTQQRPSVRVTDNVDIGYRLPSRVALYPVPPTVGVRTDYRYAFVNNRRVLVDPGTREVVYVLQ